MYSKESSTASKMFLLTAMFILVVSSNCANTNCSGKQTNFEKVIGQRPANVRGVLLFAAGGPQAQHPFAGITTECLRLCKLSTTCTSFVLSYSNASCYALNASDERRALAGGGGRHIYDTNVAWFRKTCFQKTCNKLWMVERIPAATLVGNSTKRLAVPVTRQQCHEACLQEAQFTCRSAKYRILPANSIGGYDYERADDDVTVGECVLSDSDRYLTPQGFRVSGFDDEYFENQCVELLTNKYCSFEEYPNVVLMHVDATYPNLTRLQCQKECEEFTAFRCRGYSLIPSQAAAMNSQKYLCLVHAENSKVYGPKSLSEHPGAVYYEKAPCLNIRVDCDNETMNITYNTDTEFNGKLYMKGYSEASGCYADGNRSRHVELLVPLEVHKCGLMQANSAQNRTLYSTTMILQYNNLVQTQADRIIKVGCIFGAGGNHVVVGTGFNITEDSSHVGSTDVSTANTTRPTVEMKIIDLSSNEVGDTEIGDELQLVIEMTPANGGIDIMAGHLVAMTESGQDSILLLDDRGCPTNLDVFPGLTKQIGEQSIRLTATFQAFKFSSSNVIRFSVMVTFCEEKCPEVDCAGETFYARRTKRSNADVNASVNDSFQYAEQSNADTKHIAKLPLEFTLIVRNANTKPDRLVYGENNKILVAGFDSANNEVCFDFSLLIGLIILWLLIQTILLVTCAMLIRKYKKYYEDQYLNESIEELHKNFGFGFSNLDRSRRVRFDDANMLT